MVTQKEKLDSAEKEIVDLRVKLEKFKEVNATNKALKENVYKKVFTAQTGKESTEQAEKHEYSMPVVVALPVHACIVRQRTP